jgi:hypothetical protein
LTPFSGSGCGLLSCFSAKPRFLKSSFAIKLLQSHVSVPIFARSGNWMGAHTCPCGKPGKIWQAHGTRPG